MHKNIKTFTFYLIFVYYINKEYMDRRGDIGALRRAGARLLRADFIWRDWSPAQVRDTLGL